MTRKLKFRRLISERLEPRQLFAADILVEFADADLLSDSSTDIPVRYAPLNTTSHTTETEVSIPLPEQLDDSSHDQERLDGEGEGAGTFFDPLASSLGSGSSINPAVTIIQPSQSPAGTTNLGLGTGLNLVSPSAADQVGFGRADQIQDLATAATQLKNLPALHASTSQQFSSSTSTRTLGALDFGLTSPAQDRNQIAVQVVQQRHSDNLRSLNASLSASAESTSLTRSLSQETSFRSLGSTSHSSSDRSSTSRLTSQTALGSIVRSGSNSLNHLIALDSELAGETKPGSQTSVGSQPWKISESSLNNIRRLSKSSVTFESKISYDMVMARLFGEGGLSQIDFQRRPITRIEQPWNAAQTSVRLESKVGTFRVFDVIDEESTSVIPEGNWWIAEDHRSAHLESVVQSEVADAQLTDVNTQLVECNSSEEPHINKPLFLATVLAVFSGKLLRSHRRKQPVQQLQSVAKR